jgi:hypothetical protein
MRILCSKELERDRVPRVASSRPGPLADTSARDHVGYLYDLRYHVGMRISGLRLLSIPASPRANVDEREEHSLTQMRRWIVAGSAPSTMRMPISRVRRLAWCVVPQVVCTVDSLSASTS